MSTPTENSPEPVPAPCSTLRVLDLQRRYTIGYTPAKRLHEDLAIFRWQPIESAPRDGTMIDVWEGGEFSGRWTDVFWGKPQHECGEMGQYCDSDWHSLKDGWVCSTFQEPLHFTPTHWMRSPQGPSNNQAEQP